MLKFILKTTVHMLYGQKLKAWTQTVLGNQSFFMMEY